MFKKFIKKMTKMSKPNLENCSVKMGNNNVMTQVTIGGKTQTIVNNQQTINMDDLDGFAEINGKKYSGKKITILVDDVKQDEYDSKTGNVEIIIKGEAKVQEINTNGNLHITGNIDGSCMISGNANIDGDVKGNVKIGGNGSCESVGGAMKAGGNLQIGCVLG